MLYTLILIAHIISCLFLILIVLLQAGKGAGMGAAFGGGSSAVFGGRGAGTFLGKMTTVMAAVFMILSIVLARYSIEGPRTDPNAPEDPAVETTDAPKEGAEGAAGDEADKPAEPKAEGDKPAPATEPAKPAPAAEEKGGGEAPAKPEESP